jgi:hypothetical protein
MNIGMERGSMILEGNELFNSALTNNDMNKSSKLISMSMITAGVLFAAVTVGMKAIPQSC